MEKQLLAIAHFLKDIKIYSNVSTVVEELDVKLEEHMEEESDFFSNDK